MSDWGAARATVGAGNAALDLAMPGPGRARSATRWWPRCATGARERGRRRRQGRARSLRLARARSARSAAPRRARPPRAWSDDEIAAELRATAAASFVLARNHGSLLPLSGALAAQGRGARPERRRRAHARRRQRDRLPAPTRSRRSTACARRSRTPRSRTRPACGPHTRLPVADGQRRRRALPRRRRDRARRRAPRDRRVHVARHARSGAWRRSRSTRRCAPTVAGEHVVGCSGAGRFRLSLRRRSRSSTSELALREDADPARGAVRPAAARRAGHAGRGRDARRRAAPRGRDATMVTFQLNLRAAVRRRRRRARARGRAGARGRRRDRRRRHDAGGRERGLRPHDARRCPAARTSSSGASTRRSRAPSSSSTPARRCCCRGSTRSPRVLLCWFPGQEAGNALADVLFGAAEPGGRLPTTWPASEDGLPSVTPVDGVLPYDEGLAIGYRGPTSSRCCRSATASATRPGTTWRWTARPCG